MPKLQRTKVYFQLADRLITERAEEHSPQCLSRLIELGPNECDCGTTEAREIVPASEWMRADTGPL